MIDLLQCNDLYSRQQYVHLSQLVLSRYHRETLAISSLPIKRIIYRNFDILQTNKDTKSIFTKPPLMAIHRDSNLKDILVHSKLKKREDNPGTYPCKHPRCRTCNHVSQLPTIQNLGNSFTVHKRYTCSSACLTYPIRFRKCEILYIGETCRQLNKRFGEHTRNVEHKLHEDETKKDQSDINVSQHFNSTLLLHVLRFY